MTMVEKKAIKDIFREDGLPARLYLAVKLRICPVLAVEPYLPRRGVIADLGCGNGLMAALGMLGSPDRKIRGFDLDPHKLAAARRLKNRWPSLEFETADLGSLAVPACDAVTIVDVLYLLPRPVQDAVLRRCFDALRPGGRLVLKEMDTKPLWKYAWNFFQETLSVKILGFTLGRRFHFRPAEDFRSTLRTIGFEVEVVRMDRGYWYPHTLYLGRKP